MKKDGSSKSKKFFTLNRVKIIVVIVIFILAHLPYVGYFGVGGNVANDCIGCTVSTIWINNPLFWLPYYFVGGGAGDFTAIENHFYLMHNEPLIFIFILLSTLFYWYFLSCIIYRIYLKISKSK